MVDFTGWFAGFGNFFQILGTVFLIVFFIAIFGLIMFYMFKELQFKIPIVVHKVLDNGSVIEYRDRARKLMRNGRNELKLKKLKEVIANPPPDYYMKTKKGEQIYLRWDGGHVFVPQKVTYNSPLEFKPATYNILNQMADRIKHAEERHKSKTFWDLYGNVIVWMMVIVLSAVVMIVLFTKLELVANSISDLAGAVRSMNNGQVLS
jgi:hypothetical protein